MADNAVTADDGMDLSRRKFLTQATIATGAVDDGGSSVEWTLAPRSAAAAAGAPGRGAADANVPGVRRVTTSSPTTVVRMVTPRSRRFRSDDGTTRSFHTGTDLFPCNLPVVGRFEFKLTHYRPSWASRCLARMARP